MSLEVATGYGESMAILNWDFTDDVTQAV